MHVCYVDRQDIFEKLKEVNKEIERLHKVRLVFCVFVVCLLFNTN